MSHGRRWRVNDAEQSCCIQMRCGSCRHAEACRFLNACPLQDKSLAKALEVGDLRWETCRFLSEQAQVKNAENSVAPASESSCLALASAKFHPVCLAT